MGRAALVAALAIVPLVAACGDDSGQASNAAPKTIGVTLGDFDITPSTPVTKAGAVDFQIRNSSSVVAHELVVIRSDLPVSQLPVDAAGALNEQGPGVTVVGQQGNIVAGAQVDLDVTLPAGNYVLVCNLADHFKRGMATTFTVK
jgi:uncharacterized cupredoxin-like copper-binding protein